jgi:hypothetical protein
VRLEFQLQGDLRAAFTGQFAQVSKAVDQGLDLTAKQTLDFGRVVMRQALGAKAANTIGRKTFEDTGARGIYNRWWRDGQNVPYAFSVGATIRPKERQFLAVPSPALEAGQLPTDIFQPGQLPPSAACRCRPPAAVPTARPGSRPSRWSTSWACG